MEEGSTQLAVWATNQAVLFWLLLPRHRAVKTWQVCWPFESTLFSPPAPLTLKGKAPSSLLDYCQGFPLNQWTQKSGTQGKVPLKPIKRRPCQVLTWSDQTGQKKTQARDMETEGGSGLTAIGKWKEQNLQNSKAPALLSLHSLSSVTESSGPHTGYERLSPLVISSFYSKNSVCLGVF